MYLAYKKNTKLLMDILNNPNLDSDKLLSYTNSLGDNIFVLAAHKNELQLCKYLLIDLNIKVNEEMIMYLKENEKDKVLKFIEIRDLNERVNKKNKVNGLKKI